MYEAARVDDPIYHTSALAGFLIGAIISIAGSEIVSTNSRPAARGTEYGEMR